MLKFLLFLLLPIVFTTAIDFKCTESENTIAVTCGTLFSHSINFDEQFQEEYENFSGCDHHQSSSEKVIKFRNCSLLELPTSVFYAISGTAFNIIDISNLDGKALKSDCFPSFVDDCLQNLIANHDMLKELPENMFVDTKLEYLDLSHNQFNGMESIGRSGANNLKILNVSHNEITIINEITFVNLSQLELVDLSFNNLTNLSDGTFDMLKNLRSLFLGHTNLFRIDFGILSPLKNLESLDISGNHINKIIVGTHLAIFRRLQQINISSSEVLEINGLNHSLFPNLIHLDLTTNQLSCSQLKMILDSFDLHKLELETDPSSKIKEGKSYRGVACKMDSSGITKSNSDEGFRYDNILTTIASVEKIISIGIDSTKSPVKNEMRSRMVEKMDSFIGNNFHSQKSKELHEKLDANNSMVTIIMMIAFLMLGVTVYTNWDQLLSPFKRSSMMIRDRGRSEIYSDQESII